MKSGFTRLSNYFKNNIGDFVMKHYKILYELSQKNPQFYGKCLIKIFHSTFEILKMDC